METFENTVNRILMMLGFGLDRDAIHGELVYSSEISEEEFFFAWQAAQIVKPS